MDTQVPKGQKPLPKAVIRYYIYQQCISNPPLTLIYCLEFISALQIATLMVPPTSDAGFPWDYSLLWPIWYILNAPARPDRMMLVAGVQEVKLIYAGVALLAARVLSFAIATVYLQRFSRREFMRLVGKAQPRLLARCFLKTDRLLSLLLSSVLSVPTISFITSALSSSDSLSRKSDIALAAITLSGSLLVVMIDRIYLCDLQWTQKSEGLNKPTYALLFTVCDLTAAALVPVCVLSGHDFLLRAVVAACGCVKAGYIYVSLPFHSIRVNSIKSFEGLLLVWQCLLLTVAFNSSNASLTISLCLILVSPALFYLNRALIVYLRNVIISDPIIDTEFEYDYALRIFQTLHSSASLPTDHPIIEESSNLRELWSRRLDLYPLLWTGYCCLHSNETFIMKLLIAKIGDQSVTWISCVAVDICLTRMQKHIEANFEEIALQNFLTLHKTQEKVRMQDFQVCQRMREFYTNLKQAHTVYSSLSMQVRRLHVELREVIRLYKKSVHKFSKKISLLQTYSQLLFMLGKTKRAEDMQQRVIRLVQIQKREKSSGINLLLNEDSKCVIFVVPLSGPQANTILWSVNAMKLDFPDDEIRGMNFNVLIPKAFREVHSKLLSGILSRTQEPQVFKNTYKMYVVDKYEKLHYGSWHVFATNLRPEGHFVVVATIHIEENIKEFAILSDNCQLMEMTYEFARFFSENRKTMEKIDLGATELVWSGTWGNEKVLLSKEILPFFNRIKLPIVALNKLRGRTASRQFAGIQPHPIQSRLTADRKVSFYSDSENRGQLFSRLSKKSSSRTSNYGSSFSSADDFIYSKTKKILKKQQLFSWMIGMSLLLVLLLSMAISVSVLVSAINEVESLNNGLSEMNSIGIRRFLGVTSALRSKELYMVNSGLTVIGNETRSRADLTTVSVMMKQMSLNVLGNASTASGYYRHLVMDPAIPFWRFEDSAYHLYHVTLIDLMSLLSEHAKALNATPLQNVTVDNVHFRTLYRNGPAETLQSFNHTIDAYTTNMQDIRLENTQQVVVILVVAFIVELVLGSVLSLPLLYLLEKSRRRLWFALMHLPKALLAQALSQVTERLQMYHSLEGGVEDQDEKSLKVSDTRVEKYAMETVTKGLIGAILGFMVFTALYVLHIYFIGIGQAETILDHKPLVINWSGLRRAITQFTVFSMREAWLFHSNFSYLDLVPENQYRYDPLTHMEKGYLELEYIHKSLIYGNTKSNVSDLRPSERHKELLFDTPCNDTCDPLLRKGLAPLVNEILIGFRDVWSALQRGELDYAKNGGKKVEKAVATLMPFLSTLVQQYDTDTLVSLKALEDSATYLCGVYVSVSAMIYGVVLLPLLLWVTRRQNKQRFAQEVKILRYLPKESLAEALAQKLY